MTGRAAMDPEAFQRLQALRRERWRQTPDTRIAGPDEAALLIDVLGVATLYPVSPEMPSLFHAYLGDPEARTDSGHSSPSGEVYSWRWTLGGRAAAFYSTLVRGRPTWVAWSLFPAILRLCSEPRTPDELYEAGALSTDALRVVRALEAAGGPLDTGELRRQAGFPIGKPQRAAYLKAVDELDRRLLLAKVFAPGDGAPEMGHALVRTRYPEAVAAAARLTRDAALAAFLAAYLPHAVYAVPDSLARHLKLDETELRAGLERMAAAGQAEPLAIPDQRGICYRWAGA